MREGICWLWRHFQIKQGESFKADVDFGSKYNSLGNVKVSQKPTIATKNVATVTKWTSYALKTDDSHKERRDGYKMNVVDPKRQQQPRRTDFTLGPVLDHLGLSQWANIGSQYWTNTVLHTGIRLAQ